jgi:hypothetical protein
MALDFVNKVTANGIQHNNGTVVPKPAIRFLGLFDVVDAFGIANLGGPISAVDPVHHLALPSTVQHCFHAMALDERRPQFVNHRVDGGYEVWFRGAHSDIGGSNDNPSLEHCTLRWMMSKAKLCGLPITAADVAGCDPRPDAEIKPNFFSNLSVFWRSVKPFDRVHYTVDLHTKKKDEPLNPNVPISCPRESPSDEATLIVMPAPAPAAAH